MTDSITATSNIATLSSSNLNWTTELSDAVHQQRRRDFSLLLQFCSELPFTEPVLPTQTNTSFLPFHSQPAAPLLGSFEDTSRNDNQLPLSPDTHIASIKLLHLLQPPPLHTRSNRMGGLPHQVYQNLSIQQQAQITLDSEEIGSFASSLYYSLSESRFKSQQHTPKTLNITI